MELGKEDLAVLKSIGKSEHQFLKEIELFLNPPSPPQLLRPATSGDGIIRLSKEQEDQYISVFEKNRRDKHLIKFIPASGAATRMFKIPLKFLENPSRIAKEKKEETEDYCFFRDMIEGIQSGKFAFLPVLRRTMTDAGDDLDVSLEKQEYQKILEQLLLKKGLNYASLPKALIQFHRYGNNFRTPLEEHIVEAGAYVSDQDGRIHLHVTVSPQFLQPVREYVSSVIDAYQREDRIVDIQFSIQDPATDTPVVDTRNEPIRDSQGRPVLRPGGHGALLENINRLNGDIVFINNIDNIAHQRLHEKTVRYKKVLAGYLIHIQTQIFDSLRRLAADHLTASVLEEISHFVTHTLGLKSHPPLESPDPATRRDYFHRILNRPIRVCGMVKNESEPGGGPFWITDRNGNESLQIIEKAQVDLQSSAQRAIMSAATHFNPVDLVCGIRDIEGNPFKLMEFTDPDSYFLSEKTQEGKSIRALELPGLWNGAMAGWISQMIEVPLSTFNPVKNINDLLRTEHQ